MGLIYDSDGDEREKDGGMRFFWGCFGAAFALANL